MYRTLSRNGGKRNGGLSRPRLLAPLGLKSVPDLLMPVSLNGRTYLYVAAFPNLSVPHRIEEGLPVMSLKSLQRAPKSTAGARGTDRQDSMPAPGCVWHVRRRGSAYATYVSVCP